VVRFEESDLPERDKAALRLAAAFLGAPSSLTPEARADVLRHFSPEEIVGLVLKLTSFLVNKPRAGLGIDGARDPERLTEVTFGGTDGGGNTGSPTAPPTRPASGPPGGFGTQPDR
jgi:hypothetical protein